MKSRFHYRALDAKGGEVESNFYGTIDELKDYLKSENLTLYDFNEQKPKLDKKKFTQDDFLLFIEELTYLLKAGMKIDEAFVLMLKNTKKEASQTLLKEIIHQLQAGKQFSFAFKEGTHKINYELSPLYYNLLRSGEEIGEPVYALQSLYKFLNFRIKTAKEIKGALIYPMFLLGMSILMILFVMLFVVPQFSEIFSPKELQKIPTLSRYVLESGMYLKSNLGFVSIIIFSSLLTIWFIFSKYKKQIISSIANIPLFHNFFITIEISTFFNSLGSLVNAGVTLDKALQSSTKLINIPQLQVVFQTAQENLSKGKSLSTTIEGYEIIPSYIASLLSVGEKSGSIGDISLSIAEKEMEKFQAVTKKALLLLEPAIIVLLGFFIAAIVVSIMLAVISVNDVI